MKKIIFAVASLLMSVPTFAAVPNCFQGKSGFEIGVFEVKYSFGDYKEVERTVQLSNQMLKLVGFELLSSMSRGPSPYVIVNGNQMNAQQRAKAMEVLHMLSSGYRPAVRSIECFQR